MVTYLCAVSRGHSVTTVRYGYVFMRGFTWAQCHYSSLRLHIYAIRRVTMIPPTIVYDKAIIGEIVDAILQLLSAPSRASSVHV